MVMNREIIIIAHDIRSAHNVGALLRTAEGLGVDMVYFTGYTPYPQSENDDRLPHLAAKIHKNIQKTALGAELSQPWARETDVFTLIPRLKQQGYTVVALEQAANSVKLPDFHAPDKVAVLIGREVEGIDQPLLDICDAIVEIPMFGQKESFNVVEATTMFLYQSRFVV